MQYAPNCSLSRPIFLRSILGPPTPQL
jgi:hypothetical protein